MRLVLQHLLESSVILGLLILFYRVVLHQQTTFKFNRVFLLISLVVSTVVPFIHVTAFAAETNGVVFGVMLQGVTVYSHEIKQVVVPVVSQNTYIQWIYVIGTVLFLIRLIYGLIKIGGISHNASLTKKEGFSLANMSGRFNPFSFFRIIFVNRALYSDDDLKQIMVHEKAHIRFKHSVDVLVMEALLIAQWFNPFAWIARKLLKELHEFQADREVLKTGVSVSQYKMLLLFQASGARLLPVNNFNESITKKRFKMMNLNKINNKVSFRIAISIFVIGGVSLFFACDNDIVEDDINSSSVSELKSSSVDSTDTDEPVFFIVEQMPEYPGGDAALREFIASEVNYPLEAQVQGIQGKVYVQFVVSSEGKVENAKIARSVNEYLDDEALRVVKAMPDWTPGRQRGVYVNVSYTVPINFVLNGEDTDVKASVPVVQIESANKGDTIVGINYK